MDFFDLLGNKILEMVVESRRKGSVSIALNATFIAIIPKSDRYNPLEGIDQLHYAIWCIRSSLKLLQLEQKPLCHLVFQRNNLDLWRAYK
jgi:hypothetical protein